MTKGIEVKVVSQYQPKYSDEAKNKHIFIYWVSIKNNSSRTVKLLRRHWYIFDSFGYVREVKGDGVIGMQPTLGPGTNHQYNSWSELSSDIGKMEGYYDMQDIMSKEILKIRIPTFQLIADQRLN